MSRLSIVLATLGLILQLCAAFPTPAELTRVPRHVWDTEIDKRDESASSIALADHEKFVWASTDEPNKKGVVVSMVAYSKQDERILDMDKFSFALDSASCNEDDMSFKFKNKIIYAAAKIAWGWVNYNDLRSFVLVPSWNGCGEDKSHDPWVVSSVQFDDKTQKAVLEATKSTWKQVMNTFVLDFGEVTLGGGNTKRDIIPDLDEKFRLNVGATLPSKIFEWKVNRGPLNGSLTANCDECGTQGTLVFAGHVEASLGLGGVDIDKFEISITPQGVQAHVGLSLEFVGQLDWRGGLASPSEELTLLEIPVSGWNIPGIFEFGPRIQLNAGYVIDYIGGEASVSTGITASIPDTAIAKLDLLSEDSVQISGWTPEISTDPLEIVAQIDAEARLYTEIALSVSLTVLDDNGFGVDLAFKLPEVTVTTAGGYKSNGFCDGSENPWGVTVDASVGANLALEGWKELDGDKDTLFGVSLFDTDDLFEFPQLCLGFEETSDGYCPGEEDVEWATDASLGTANKRSTFEEPPTKTSHALLPRQSQSSRRPYHVECDASKTYPITVLNYPQPGSIRLNTDVPIIKPQVTCAPMADDCEPYADNEIIWGPASDRAFVRQDNAASSSTEARTWATEHIYEGNWIKEYLDHLGKLDFFKGSEDTCNDKLLQFWDTNKPPTNVTPPRNQPKTYLEALLQNLGTTYTYKERMVLLPMTQNTHKYNIFARKELISDFNADEDKHGDYTHGRRACDLARIVTSCNYYGLDEVQKRLRATIEGIESVLDSFNTDYKEHKKFYNELYEKGITHARDSLQRYAQWMLDNDSDDDDSGMDELSGEAKKQVEIIAAGSDWDKYCKSTPRTGW
ncbi:hypothetical protein BDV59DRAFT_206929 [Aspergillus ambiguus]|uniref:uncharacterized protein n=1 Tax=Aspergillus ambiguus TaxID=176160 RepID=UPI003CCCF664